MDTMGQSEGTNSLADTTEKSEKSVVEQIIDIVKRGDVIPYSLIHEFLTLENGDTYYQGELNHEGVLGMQLRNAKDAGLMSLTLCGKTICRNDEMYIKLLRLFAHYSSYPINTLTTVEERETLMDNMSINFNLITLGRDNIPMDENGDIIESYQKMMPTLCKQTKQAFSNSPEKAQKSILDTCDPPEINNSEFTK